MRRMKLVLLMLGLILTPAIVQAQSSADIITPAATTVNLTADIQVVTVGNSSYLKLSSNNATATNRTFCLSAGTSGQNLTIELIAQAAEFTDNANPCGGAGTTPNLTATYAMGVDDTIQLIYNGAKWNEVSRANN